MLHDDSFITGLLIGDKRGYDRGYEEGGGGASQSRDTIEFGDGMTVDIWKVPHYFDAPNLENMETEFLERCFMSTLRSNYCCAILMANYGFANSFASMLDPRRDPAKDPEPGDYGRVWVRLNPSDDEAVLTSSSVTVSGAQAIAPWDGDMWFVVTPTFIGAIIKLRDYQLPVIWWAFTYAQGKDGGEWRPWVGTAGGSTTNSYNGTAGDLSKPATSVTENFDPNQLRINLSNGQAGQVDNLWEMRTTYGIRLDSGDVKVDPNFKSVGTSTRHKPTGRRLLYLAHTEQLGGGSYSPLIYNFKFVLLPRGVSGATWHGLMDKAFMESFWNGSNTIGEATVNYDQADINSENMSNSYYAGYNAGYEAGLAGGSGNPDDGSYDEGYQAGYQAGYTAGLAAAGDDDGYTLHPAADGATELHISIEAAALRAQQLCFCQTVAHGVSIDWGDGSATETVGGTGPVYPTHDYNSNGDYVIRLIPADGCELTLGGGTSKFITVFNGSGTAMGSASCGVVLKKALVGDRVPTVGNSAFHGCTNLEEAYVPDGTVGLGQYCFRQCGSLHRVRLPSSLTTLGGGCFDRCYGLGELSISAGVKAVGVNEFTYCQGLRKLSLPGAESIGASAFGTCYGLQRLDLPATLKTWAGNATVSCVNLKEIHVAASVPPTLNANLSMPSACVVYIPAGSLAAYSSANYWKNIAARLIEE